jgi:hypothetical protein
MSQESAVLPHAAPQPCSRCKNAPRLKGQRWCRQCLTESQRARRAERQGTQSDAASAPVTQAEIQAMATVTQGEPQAPATALPEAEQVRTEALQPPTEPAQPVLSPEAARVLQHYRATAREMEFFRTLDAQAWRRWPSPAMVYDPLVRQLAALKQRLVELGIDP